MNLNEMRQLFVDLSGRLDYAETTIDMYLNAGQRFLDDAITGDHLNGKILEYVEVGTWMFALEDEPKLIEAVSLYNTSGIKYDLINVPVHQMKLLSDELPAFESSGTPSYYTLVALRHIPDNTTLSLEDLAGKFPVIETATDVAPNAILFNCPVDSRLLLEVSGKFYNKQLTKGTDTSWWAKKYGLTVVHSALYKMELGYRNREGAADWLNAITPVLGEVIKNSIEQEAVNVTRMEG